MTTRLPESSPALVAGADDGALLLRRAEAGDAQAFEQIAWRYDVPLLGLFLLLTSSERQAQELCCATFLAAFKRLRARDTDSLYIWFYRVAAEVWLKRTARRGAAVEALTGREQLVFAMKAGQRLGLRTIAQILDVPDAVAAAAFTRAVAKLQQDAGTGQA